MKRLPKYLKYLLIIPLFLFIYSLSGCLKKSEIVSAIEVVSTSTEKIGIDGFNYDEYQLKVTYENGDSELIPFTEDMVDEYDRLALYKAGEHDLHVTYKRCETTLHVEIELNSFDNSIKFESKKYVYDGTPKKIEVEGDLPDGTQVIYTRGNEFTNAASYEKLEASLVCEGYYPKTLYANLTIERAEYDYDFKFEDVSAAYDGLEHSIKLEGELPNTLSISYQIKSDTESEFTVGNSAYKVGIYSVMATFTNTNQNYKTPSPVQATLRIEMGEYDLSNFTFTDEEIEYDGKNHTLELRPIDPNIAFPEALLIYYSYDGNDPDYTNRGVKDVHVGENDYYTVTAKFQNYDTNYKTPEPMEAKLKIVPSMIYLSDVVFDSNSYTYEIEGYRDVILEEETIKEEIPRERALYCNADKEMCEANGVPYVEPPLSVRFAGYKEDLSSAEYSTKPITKTQAGVYSVFACFECLDRNHVLENDGVFEAILEIRKAKYTINSSCIKYCLDSLDNPQEDPNIKIEYDGIEHAVLFNVDAKQLKSLPFMVKQENQFMHLEKHSEPGEYIYKKELEIIGHSNYEITNPTFISYLTIEPKVLDVNVELEEEQHYKYNGLNHYPDFKINVPFIIGTQEAVKVEVKLKYYDADEYIEMPLGKQFIEIGIYKFQLIITCKDPHYKLEKDTYEITVIIE